MGCVGCQAKMRGEITRRGHSEKCRKRIEEAMRNDEKDKKKLEKTDERIHFRIAKDIEKADRKRKADGDQEEDNPPVSDRATGSQEGRDEDRTNKVRFDDRPAQH